MRRSDTTFRKSLLGKIRIQIFYLGFSGAARDSCVVRWWCESTVAAAQETQAPRHPAAEKPGKYMKIQGKSRKNSPGGKTEGKNTKNSPSLGKLAARELPPPRLRRPLHRSQFTATRTFLDNGVPAHPAYPRTE